MEFNRISIIITCYKPEEMVEKSIKNFAEQDMAKFIDLVIVDDCSPYTKDGYKSIINKYKNKINIQYLKTPQNCGPGDARQYGFDNAEPKNEFIIFHDADEYYRVPAGLTPFFEAIKKDVNNIFPRYISGYVLLKEQKDKSWKINFCESEQNQKISGHCFRRSFLEKNNIRFCHELSYCDEDTKFFFDVDLILAKNNQKNFYIKNKICCIIPIEQGHDSHGMGGDGVLTIFQKNCQFLLLCLCRIDAFNYVKHQEEFIINNILENISYCPHFINYIYNNKNIWYTQRNSNNKININITKQQLFYINKYIDNIMYIFDNLDKYCKSSENKDKIIKHFSSGKYNDDFLFFIKNLNSSIKDFSNLSCKESFFIMKETIKEILLWIEKNA